MLYDPYRELLHQPEITQTVTRWQMVFTHTKTATYTYSICSNIDTARSHLTIYTSPLTHMLTTLCLHTERLNKLFSPPHSSLPQKCSCTAESWDQLKRKMTETKKRGTEGEVEDDLKLFLQKAAEAKWWLWKRRTKPANATLHVVWSVLVMLSCVESRC